MPDLYQFELDILPQPDEITCGPTCLHSVYRYFGDELPLETLIQETAQLEEGGTLAVLLGCHALARGYRATIYTFNLHVFDPTWFSDEVDLSERLQAQLEVKTSPKFRRASEGYLQFLSMGGSIQMQDLDGALLRRYLRKSIPLLTGLSATYLYRCPREIPPNWAPDDIRGEAQGHFVVLCGYDASHRSVHVADPYLPNPLGERHHYEVSINRLICAVMLGVLTYDANLLVIQPKKRARRKS